MPYEVEQDDTEPIANISKREFQDNEFKAGFKQGKFMFYGTFKRKNRDDHYKKMKEVFK